jgi:hypothetical protein
MTTAEEGPRALLDRWNRWTDRQLWRNALAILDPDRRPIAEKQLATLESATALDALAANVELVRLMTGWRWQAIQSAREDGATWEEIGSVLGTTKQGAQLAYKRAIEAQEQHAADFHDAAAARAAL